MTYPLIKFWIISPICFTASFSPTELLDVVSRPSKDTGKLKSFYFTACWIGIRSIQKCHALGTLAIYVQVVFQVRRNQVNDCVHGTSADKRRSVDGQPLALRFFHGEAANKFASSMISQTGSVVQDFVLQSELCRGSHRLRGSIKKMSPRLRTDQLFGLSA